MLNRQIATLKNNAQAILMENEVKLKKATRGLGHMGAWEAPTESACSGDIRLSKEIDLLLEGVYVVVAPV